MHRFYVSRAQRCEKAKRLSDSLFWRIDIWKGKKEEDSAPERIEKATEILISRKRGILNFSDHLVVSRGDVSLLVAGLLFARLFVALRQLSTALRFRFRIRFGTFRTKSVRSLAFSNRFSHFTIPLYLSSLVILNLNTFFEDASFFFEANERTVVQPLFGTHKIGAERASERRTCWQTADSLFCLSIRN